MNSLTPTRLVQEIQQVVSLPDACVRLNELIDDPKSSALDIADVIIQDTDLSARLLRVVNSAFYALPGPVETISRAVTIVGTKELRDLAVVTAACDLFQGIPSELLNMNDFWHYSVTTGILARALAAECHVLHKERLFVMGVLHDIGRLVILQHLPAQARDILLITNTRLDLLPYAENEVLGFTHAEVGFELVRNWGLPESIATVVHWHHDPIGVEEFQLETALIHIGQVLAFDLVWRGDQMQSLACIEPQVWEITGLSADKCMALGAEVGAQIMELFSVLMGDNGNRRNPGN